MLAALTGRESGLLVLDVDTIAGHGVDGEAALDQLARRHGPLPPTVESRTPGGGRHLWYVYPAGRAIRSGQLDASKTLAFFGPGLIPWLGPREDGPGARVVRP